MLAVSESFLLGATDGETRAVGRGTATRNCELFYAIGECNHSY